LIVLTPGTINRFKESPMDTRARYLIGLTFILAITAQYAHGQVTQKKTLNLEGARRVIAAAVAEAKRGAGTAAIAVVDDGGNLIAVERLDNTFSSGTNVSIGKARTAVLFKKPTRFFEDLINKGRTAMASLSASEGFTPLQGGVPIVVDGQIVGGVGVSGAASAQQDEEIAIAGANALASSSAVSSAPRDATYFKSAAVAESFAKGAILYDGRGVNYQVHTSRRVAPGQAEIHAKETDIIYVLDGEATLVTGGKAMDVKETAPDELRGSRIDGGEVRKLVKGDVIVVPAGVPHWFKEVRGELHYYVVKVS
jgi:glc operon protein GlcG